MSLQIFLYQGLAGLYEELSTIQIKGGNIWNTSRDMMIYICINIFICAEQLIKPRLYLKMSKTSFIQTKMKWESTVTHNLQTSPVDTSQVLTEQESQSYGFLGKQKASQSNKRFVGLSQMVP